MIKPVLPSCLVAGCTRAAGAIVNEALLCGEHAKIELERVLKQRRAWRMTDSSDDDERPQEQNDVACVANMLIGPGPLGMSDKDNSEEVARLERLNEDLSDSLRRCRKLLHDYEVRLTANSNEQSPDESDEEQRKA